MILLVPHSFAVGSPPRQHGCSEGKMDKKEKIKAYKQTIQPMGIYQITNTTNGKIFLGSAKDLRAKLNSQKFQLQNGVHPIRGMQSDFTAVGEEAFSFEVLDYLEPQTDPTHDYTEDLNILKEMWLAKLQPYDARGYHKKR
jgi:hypothetical protein